jgi:hypothetical protein
MRARPLAGLIIMSVLLGLVVLPGPAGGFAPFPHHRCGSYLRPAGESEGYEYPSYRITVYNSDGLACKLATEVIQAFWDPDSEPEHHGGRSEAESWYTTDRFPSWRCTQGAGGGSCRHKHKVAGYSVKVA